MPVALPGYVFNVEPYALIDHVPFEALVEATGLWNDKGLWVELLNGFAARCTTKRRAVESTWEDPLYESKMGPGQRHRGRL